MFSVKLESEKRLTVCRGCLSTDRKLIPLQNGVDVFLMLLRVQDYCETELFLCWECIANIKQVRSFQNRIQHAQFILQQSLYELQNLPITSLSTLSSVTKTYYDHTIDYEPPIQEKVDPKDFYIEIIKEEKAHESHDEFDDDGNRHGVDDSFSDDEILTIDYNKLKQLDIVENTVKKEETSRSRSRNKIQQQSIRRYENKATVKKINEEETAIYKNWSKVTLTEMEIEDVLRRDRLLYGFRRLPHKCKECQNSYTRLLDLRRHQTFNHTKPSFPTKCQECRFTINSWDELEKHWAEHNVYNKCNLCGWHSHSTSSMTKHHNRVHTMVYCCNYCNIQCRTLREFSIHYKDTHEKGICDHCGKNFAKKRTLAKHIKRHHTPATCFECNKTYAHYHVLQNHYRMYHPHMIRADNRTELAYCVECDKQFPSVYKYRRHLATAAKHTPPKPISIPCPECGKVFARKIRMTNHFNAVHRNTTKHRCDICNKAFCSAFSVRTHIQHVHEKIPMPKNKMCDICGRGFSTNRILTNHRRTHTGERPYKCGHCPATFAQRTAMKTHERTQHKAQWDSTSALSAAAATLLELGDREDN